MAANDGSPEWYRGPADPSGYRVRVCEDLKYMRRQRARLPMLAMAKEVGALLGRNIPESSVGRWESGAKLAGADVYRAYMDVSQSPRPTDLGGLDHRADPGRQVSELEARTSRIERELGIATAPGEGVALDDLIPVGEAMELARVTRQTIHNWVRQGKVRSSRRGARHLDVSRSDVLLQLQKRS